MAVLLVGREAAVAEVVAPTHLAYDKHVGVVPVAGLGVGIELYLLLEADAVEALPSVGDVARGTPRVGIDRFAPLPDVGHAVLAEAVEDVAGLLSQVALHEEVGTDVAGDGLPVGLLGMLASIAAPVVLQVVDAPAVVALGVLQLVVDRTEVAAACEVAGRRVDAELESFGVEPVAEVLHAGELLVDGNRAVGITLGSLPAVVDVHVAIAVVGQALIDERLGTADDLVLRDAQTPAVPAVPSHRRRQANLAAAANRELLLLLALCILCLDGKGVGAGHLERAAESAVVGVDGKASGQVVGSNLHGAVAADTKAEMDGRAGTNAVEGRGVEARLSRSGGRQNVLRDVLRLDAQSRLALGKGGYDANHLTVVVGDADDAVLLLIDRDLHCLLAQHLAGLGVFHLDGEVATLRGLHFAVKRDDALAARCLLDVDAEVIDGIWHAYLDGTGEHAARVACIIATDGNHVVGIPLYQAAVSLHAIDARCVPVAAVAARVFREGARLADELAVEINLIGVVNLSHVEVDGLFEVGLLEHRLRNVDVIAIPAEAVLDFDALRGPRHRVLDVAPTALINVLTRPRHIVACMELSILQTDLLRKGCEGHCAGQCQHGKELFHHNSLVLGYGLCLQR